MVGSGATIDVANSLIVRMRARIKMVINRLTSRPARGNAHSSRLTDATSGYWVLNKWGSAVRNSEERPARARL
jgi:hypothetical protein